MGYEREIEMLNAVSEFMQRIAAAPFLGSPVEGPEIVLGEGIAFSAFAPMMEHFVPEDRYSGVLSTALVRVHSGIEVDTTGSIDVLGLKFTQASRTRRQDPSTLQTEQIAVFSDDADDTGVSVRYECSFVTGEHGYPTWAFVILGVEVKGQSH